MVASDSLRGLAVGASTLGGVLVLLGAAALAFVALAGVGDVRVGAPAQPLSGAEEQFARGAIAAWFAFWSIATAVVAFVGAWRVWVAPTTAAAWGIVILVAGVLSFLAGGGFGVGALALITGGVLAIIGGHEATAARARAA